MSRRLTKLTFGGAKIRFSEPTLEEIAVEEQDTDSADAANAYWAIRQIPISRLVTDPEIALLVRTLLHKLEQAGNKDPHSKNAPD
jgi:hypothetical protein